MAWLKLDENTSKDIKFQMIATDLAIPLKDIVCLWVELLQRAKQISNDSEFTKEDILYTDFVEEIVFQFGYTSTDEVLNIISAFEAKKLIKKNIITNFKKHQSDPTNATRQKRSRLKKKFLEAKSEEEIEKILLEWVDADGELEDLKVLRNDSNALRNGKSVTDSKNKENSNIVSLPSVSAENQKKDKKNSNDSNALRNGSNGSNGKNRPDQTRIDQNILKPKTITTVRAEKKEGEGFKNIGDVLVGMVNQNTNYDILKHISESGHDEFKVLTNRSGWDKDVLIEKYNSWVSGKGVAIKFHDKAFLTWVKNYTKNKQF